MGTIVPGPAQSTTDAITVPTGSSLASTTTPTTSVTTPSFSSSSHTALSSARVSTSTSVGLTRFTSTKTSSDEGSKSTETHTGVPTTTYVKPTTSASAVSNTLAAASATSMSQSEASPSWMTTPIFGGVVAGSFVLGALIAGLFVFAVLRKRPKRSQRAGQSKYVSEHDHTYGGGKASAMSTVTTLAEPNFLPQQIEDAEVTRRILNLTDQIDQHVENFYRNGKVHVDESVEAAFSTFETRQMLNPLASCFDIATQPLVLIRHCLAFHVFSETVAPGEDTELILPAEIAGMVSVMYHKCLSSTTPRDTMAAFSLWKNLTAYLRPHLANEATSMRATSDVAHRFARQFSRAFSSWSNPQYTEDHRVDHLAALVGHAIDTGTWLFLQPESYRFNWNTLSYSGRNSPTNMMMRETVVVPGIFKMTHAGALLNGQGQSLVQPVVRRF